MMTFFMSSFQNPSAQWK